MTIDPFHISVVLFFTSLLACIPIFLFVVSAKPERRKPLRLFVICYAVATFFWGVFHAGDGDPWQWASAGISVGAFLMALTYLIALAIGSLAHKVISLHARRDKSPQQSPAGDVQKATPEE